MIPAIAYIRVSTKDQKDHGYSIPGQLAEIENYCRLNRLELVKVYIEDHSGFDLNRPKLTEARQPPR